MAMEDTAAATLEKLRENEEDETKVAVADATVGSTETSDLRCSSIDDDLSKLADLRGFENLAATIEMQDMPRKKKTRKKKRKWHECVPQVRDHRRRYFDLPKNLFGGSRNCNGDEQLEAICKSEPRKKPCYLCGGFGHRVQDCKQKKGHLFKGCKNQVNYTDAQICLRCGEPGHDMASCKASYSADDLKMIRCNTCEKFGHLCCIDSSPDTCPSWVVSCYNCGQSGHGGLACHILRRDHTRRRMRKCCFCRKEGHYPVDCLNGPAKARQKVQTLSNPNQKNVKEGLVSGSHFASESSSATCSTSMRQGNLEIKGGENTF